MKKTETMQSHLEAEDERKEQQHADEVSKNIQRTEGRLLQLQSDKHVWQTATEDRRIHNAEVLIDKKMREEAARLIALEAELRAATTAPRRQRPRSAIVVRPRTGGIGAYSSDTHREVASVCSDATHLGPRISVVHHRAYA